MEFVTGIAAAETGLGVWGTRGGVGFVLQNGTYLAQRPGKGEVFFASPDGSPPLSAPLTVVGASTGDAAGFAAKLTLTPDVSNPLRATLLIHVANAEGDPLSNEPVAITITGGKADAPIVTTDRKGDAQIGITWEAVVPNTSERGAMVSSPTKRFGDAKTALAPTPKPGS